MKTALALLLLGLTLVAQSAEAGAAKDQRMAWFREARFGMFIHWGLYAIPAGTWQGKEISGTGEWIMRNGKITPADYEPLREQWNPVKFDAKAWAKVAKAAGMKYVVITTKHHDGFALFDSAVSDWDVGSTPNKTDIMMEIATAFRAEGLRIGWYHSILDWHHPDYLPRRDVDKRPASEADFDRFVVYLKAQLQEILTRYGTIDMLWFDGEWESSWNRERGWDLYNHCRALSPSTIINNRVGGGRNDMQGLDKGAGFAGDFGTPEQEIPSGGLPGVDWESCMTMNNTWGWRSDDKNWKSVEELVHNLVDCASKGGNYLLNVGPTPEGEIPQPSVERLAAMGQWMDRNSASIRGTTVGPFLKPLPYGRCTARKTENGIRLYVHVFDWPVDGKLLLSGLQATPQGAHLLVGGTPVGVAISADGVRLAVPKVCPDALDTVVVLDCVGTVSVKRWHAAPAADGSVLLPAAEAELHGSLRHENSGTSIGFWTNAKDTLSWPLRVEKAGRYSVEVELAVDPSHGGGEYAVALGVGRITAKPETTGAWNQWRTDVIGTLELSAGEHELTVSIVTKPHAAVMNVRRIVLKPLP
ncbi:MAG: carbohydrate-binding protein [Planctomycetes bacterium]|nr:carbohydrate-binding protein [Planctomycetota bacterium]